MRAELDRELRHLEDALLDMGSMCQQAVSFSGAVLMKNDSELREQVAELEIEIDKKDREIEKLCTGLILRQSPVAGDLRFVSTALKIVPDMERIGEQAEDIAELADYILKKTLVTESRLSDICCAVSAMVTESIEAMVKKDLYLARKVIRDDERVDRLFETIKDRLVGLIRENRTDPQEIIDILMAAKYYERVGNHAVNIAVGVEYFITGNRTGVS